MIDETRRLQACLNDLIGVMALPALWTGWEPSEIAGAFLDGVVGMLDLEFAYADIDGSVGAVPAQMIRCPGASRLDVNWTLATELVRRWLDGKVPTGVKRTSNPFGAGELTFAVIPLGSVHDVGVLVAGSTRERFPTATEALLLRVACNQATIALLEARRMAERKRASQVLEERVAQRTAELTATNAELTNEIAERRRAEADLNKIAALVQNSDDFIAIASLEGDVVFLNEAGRSLVGLQRERRLGDIHIIEFVSDDERARLGQMIWPSVLRYGRWEGETCFRHFLTGEPIDMHQHIFVVREPESGEPVAVATVSRDITQRKRAQAEVVALKDEIAVELAEMTRLHRVSMRLFESPELRTMLDDVLGAAMALQDADFGTIQLYNPEAGGLEMVAHRGFAGDFAERFFLVKGEDTVCGRAFRAGTRVIVEDVEQDAKFAPYLAMAAAEGFRAVQSTPLASHAGALLGIISTHFREPHRPTEQQLRFTDLYARQAADMIERNNVESALGKARQDLAHVARVTMMGELTASIAHEVNQPLAAVVTNANACVHWLGAPSPNASEAQAALRRIMRDANRASEVIARIRAFLLRGKPQRSAVRIEDVIVEVVELLENEARAKSVSIDVSAIADVSAVMADRVQLQQVLLNLVVNAIEAMAVTSQRPRAIQIGTGPHNGDEIRVSVRDSGPGLDPKDLERVFDMFYTTKSHGMGMGLAISRSIIEAHGGRLWATAGEGGGEVFQFTLPVHAGTAA